MRGKLLQAVENTEHSIAENTAGGKLDSPEDALRGQIYRLLAGFLTQSPNKISLKNASRLEGDEGDFGRSLNNFAKIAAQISPEAADTEFHDLFIGVTRGELLPYGSYYLTGFLNEKPLASLRADLRKLGIERVEGLNEPEDHIASVLEIMAGLIEGKFGQSASLAEQKRFFDSHVNSWATHFFTDLESAKHSTLYLPLGSIGRLFMVIEQEAFEMS